MGEEVLLLDFRRRHFGELVPGDVAVEFDPHALLDRFAAGGHHDVAGVVGEVVALFEELLLGGHHLGHGGLIFGHDGLEILVDHDGHVGGGVAAFGAEGAFLLRVLGRLVLVLPIAAGLLGVEGADAGDKQARGDQDDAGALEAFHVSIPFFEAGGVGRGLPAAASQGASLG